MDDFRKYATKHLGMNSLVLDDVIKSQAGYLNPYILEERQLNVTQLDVFSRLMMDRIIFLGTQIDDYTANTLQAQLLYLDSVDPGKDISIYINSPGGSVYAGLGIYDTMQFISQRCSHHLHRYGCQYGGSVVGGRSRRQAFCTDALARNDSPADGRRTRTSLGH